MKILFAGNQGGMPVVRLNCAVARALATRLPDAEIDFVVWLRSEAAEIRNAVPEARSIGCYEEFLEEPGDDWRQQVERLVREYPEVNWSAVVASERSFTDSSFLLGGAGHRAESKDYVERLVVNIVRFFERLFAAGRYDAVFCQTADSLFTHILFKVAQHFGAKLFAISPAWLQEGGRPGSFFTNDEFMRCDRMIAAYRALTARSLTPDEVARAERFRQVVAGFDGNKAFYSVNKRSFGRNPLSPNVWRLPSYILANQRRNKDLDYTRIDPWAKARGNVLRLWRWWRSSSLIGAPDTPVPPRSVFFALHFQPEQSTLVGGITYANQIGLIENIAKSLPLGTTLVLKEHPAGRGARPAWQYRHLASFPNVIFCDAPSKAIAAQVEAVVTITGTIGIEAMALDKPVIVLGRTFFDYAEILYRAAGVHELPQLFRRILVEREYDRRVDRVELIHKFLLSYLAGLTSHYPVPETAPHLADALADHLVSANLLPQAS